MVDRQSCWRGRALWTAMDVSGRCSWHQAFYLTVNLAGAQPGSGTCPCGLPTALTGVRARSFMRSVCHAWPRRSGLSRAPCGGAGGAGPRRRRRPLPRRLPRQAPWRAPPPQSPRPARVRRAPGAALPGPARAPDPARPAQDLQAAGHGAGPAAGAWVPRSGRGA